MKRNSTLLYNAVMRSREVGLKSMARYIWPFEKIGSTQGPWQCERCGNLSQFCDVGIKLNRIYCMNEQCDFLRIIDKATSRIMEDDGTVWSFKSDGSKERVRAR